MDATGLVGWLLVALGCGTGVLCLLRSRAAGTQPYARRTARAEGAMGLGMAMMAIPGRALGDGDWSAALPALLFGVLALRTAVFAHGESHRIHHTLKAATMLYMTVAMTGGGTGSGSSMDMGHSGMGVPLVNAALLAYFTVYLLRAGTVSLTGGQSDGNAVDVWQTPELSNACRMALALGMLVMVLLM